MINNCTSRVTFNFYGLPVQVFVETAGEVDILMQHYSYFYDDNLNTSNILSLWFGTSDMAGFFTSIFSRAKNTKYIYVSENGDPDAIKEYCTFSDWSGITSPFPPFIFEPLCSNYICFQGSSLTINNLAYCFLGVPFSGKSTIVNWVVRSVKQTVYLSDDITVCSLNNLFLNPFPTLTAIRTECKRWFKNPINVNKKQSIISDITGLVEYYNIDELYGKRELSPAKLQGIFILNNQRNSGLDLEIKPIDTSSKINTLCEYQLPFNGEELLYLHRESFVDVPMYEIIYDINTLEEFDFLRTLGNIINLDL